MTSADTIGLYGKLTAPDTLVIERLLPGPIERVWSYLTDSDKRAKWLASGEMPLKVGAEFTLTWHNDTLTSPPGSRPEGFGPEHTMVSRILAVDAPRLLSYTFGTSSEVDMTLTEQGDKVLLTLTHRRIPDRGMVLMVGPGWHAHLDVLAARLGGPQIAPFWDHWQRLRDDYTARLGA
ncbi:MAG: SRPBCC family protein [Rhodobacteraceae bacterium]|nr:SRPBCC family protein [Paracoccaceae bacterium]